MTYERKKKDRELPIDKVYVLIGSSPNSQFLRKIGIVTESFDQASFSRDATDKLVSGLVRGSAQERDSSDGRSRFSPWASPNACRSQSSASPAESIWDTTVVPNQEEQMLRRHQELAVSRAKPANTDRITASSLDGARSGERDSPDSVWGTRWEPNRGVAVAALHAQISGTTEKLRPGQGTAAAGSQAPALPPSPVAVRKGDALPGSAPSQGLTRQCFERFVSPDLST